MRFEEFRATKKRLAKAEAEKLVGTDIYNPYALVYSDYLYIEEVEPSMKYHLVIGRCDFISSNLDELEAKLYVYLCEDIDVCNASLEPSSKDTTNEQIIKLIYNIPENWYF